MSDALIRHQAALRDCRACPDMVGPVIVGEPVASPVLSIGQAPGIKEGEFGRPFAWTAGKTLFRWFESIGLPEADYRRRVYMAAVCRCFPGKHPKGGDRVPDRAEIANCDLWLAREFELLRPQLVIPIGKLAIARFLDFRTLDEVIGARHRLARNGLEFDLIPLPHPSGLSTWFKTEPGRTLLDQALREIASHPAWRELVARAPTGHDRGTR